MLQIFEYLSRLINIEKKEKEMKRDLKINLTVNKLNFAQQFYYQVYDYDG